MERVTLSIANDEGELARTGIPGPGGELRVGVGATGRRSAVWKIWANKRKNDVYIATRGLGTTQKWSLHESGDWRFQWTTPAHGVRYTGQSRRVIDRWARPEELARGWTKGISIWVPHDGLSLIPDDPEDGPKAVTYLPEAEPGHAIGLHVVFARTDHGSVKTGGALPLGGFWIASGEVVLVLAQQKRMTDKDIAWLRANHRRAVAMLPAALSSDSTVRVSMHGQYDDAVRWIWDMGLGLGLWLRLPAAGLGQPQMAVRVGGSGHVPTPHARDPDPPGLISASHRVVPTGAYRQSSAASAPGQAPSGPSGQDAGSYRR